MIAPFFDYELSEFLLEHKRLPTVDDERKPWSYRGWAIPYVAQMHGMADIPDRWGYYIATLEQGSLLDEPIPKMRFTGAGAVDGLKHLANWESIVEAGGGGWSSFAHLIDWLAWSLSVSGEPPKLSEKVMEQLYRAVDLSVWLRQPSDYLGTHVSQRKAHGWNPNGFFPTPHEIVEAMTLMTMGDGDLRLATVCDPTVGTGRMLLHASNYSLCLYGMDIDATVLRCCQINGALYAPWMVFPLPAGVLGRAVPDPPPMALPVPKEHINEAALRVDDRGQGSLF